MRVSELYGEGGPMFGRDVYVVGMGSSMRMFPTKFLEDKFCVLLNDACWHFPTLGPVSLSNNKRFVEDCVSGNIRYWVCKARLKGDDGAESDDNHVPWGHHRYHCFSYRHPPWDRVSHFDQRQIWAEPCHYWNVPNGTVAIFAVQFAVMAGARSVTLVGCDGCNISSQRYINAKAGSHRIRKARNAIVRKKSSLNLADFRAYIEGLSVIQRRALEDHGVPVVSMTPFVALGNIDQQFRRWHKVNGYNVDTGLPQAGRL